MKINRDALLLIDTRVTSNEHDADSIPMKQRAD